MCGERAAARGSAELTAPCCRRPGCGSQAARCRQGRHFRRCGCAARTPAERRHPRGGRPRAQEHVLRRERLQAGPGRAAAARRRRRRHLLRRGSAGRSPLARGRAGGGRRPAGRALQRHRRWLEGPPEARGQRGRRPRCGTDARRTPTQRPRPGRRRPAAGGALPRHGRPRAGAPAPSRVRGRHSCARGCAGHARRGCRCAGGMPRRTGEHLLQANLSDRHEGGAPDQRARLRPLLEGGRPGPAGPGDQEARSR
mmetsp:Transcript_4288/g.13391  ORF Transcript_4288/g.13391 Transcript_4288/m.13391 type:complete len:254 (+) Transcript_4288:426-1187(+)